MLFIPKNKYGFSADGNAIDKPDKINIQKHLSSKNIIKKILWRIKKVFIGLSSFCKSCSIKCMSLNNENWITGLNLIDLSPVKLIYYPLIKSSLSEKMRV